MDLDKNNQALDYMKKIIIFILISVSLIGMTSCVKEKEEDISKSDVVNNSLFTDDFFLDVVEIGDTRFGTVSSDQMKPVIRYFKSLYLTETDFILDIWDENGEIIYYGTDVLYFLKSDGTKLTIIQNHKVFSNVYGDGISYVVPDDCPTMNIGMEIAFALSD